MSPLILNVADSQLTVSPFGGQALSWRTGGQERLWLSQEADITGTLPIRGGVPLCFPWFGKGATGPSHGFARTSQWQPLPPEHSASEARLTLTLQDSERTRALWPHGFRAAISHTLTANALEMALTVTNTDDHPWAYTAALHSYLAADATTLSLPALAGRPYLDKLENADRRFDEGPGAALPPIPVDAIVPGLETMTLAQGGSTLRIQNHGHDATVVWNPGPDHGIADIHAGGESAFICLESAIALAPLTLAPGQSHTLSQRLLAIG